MPMGIFRYFRYRRLPRMEKHDLANDDETTQTTLLFNTQPTWTRKQATVVFLGNIVLFLTSICLLGVTIIRSPSSSQLECAKKVSPYSPIWEAVEFSENNFVNDFNASSAYRGPPTLEREQAWHSLWHYHLVPVNALGIDALNQTGSGRHVEVIGSDPTNPEYGATIELFHQLHCLNVLRQSSWPLKMFDQSWGELYPSFIEDPEKARIHVDHCIESLRLTLMCSGDITPVLFVYDETHPNRVRPDFNAHHKCRDFNRIVEYVKKNGVEIQISQ